MFFKNWYKEYKEMERENQFYSRECFLKEERIRDLNKENKELKEKINQLEKELKNVRTSKRNTNGNEVKRTQRGRPKKVCNDERTTN